MNLGDLPYFCWANKFLLIYSNSSTQTKAPNSISVGNDMRDQSIIESKLPFPCLHTHRPWASGQILPTSDTVRRAVRLRWTTDVAWDGHEQGARAAAARVAGKHMAVAHVAKWRSCGRAARGRATLAGQGSAQQRLTSTSLRLGATTPIPIGQQARCTYGGREGELQGQARAPPWLARGEEEEGAGARHHG